jgi:hypothetical protein
MISSPPAIDMRKGMANLAANIHALYVGRYPNVRFLDVRMHYIHAI